MQYVLFHLFSPTNTKFVPPSGILLMRVEPCKRSHFAFLPRVRPKIFLFVTTVAKLVICKPKPISLEMNAAGGGRALPSFKFSIYKNCLHPTVSSFHLFSCFSVFSQENIIGNLEITHFAIFSGIYQTSGNMNPTLTLKCLKGNG